MINKYVNFKILLTFLSFFLIFMLLSPKWFIGNSFLNTNNIDKNKSTIKNYNILQLINPEIPKNILEKNIIISESLQLETENNTNNNKKTPEILVIYLQSFNTLAEAKKFCLGLENKRIPCFIHTTLRKTNKNIFSYINKKEYGVFIGPELDIDAINLYIKEIKLIGLTGSITSYNIL